MSCCVDTNHFEGTPTLFRIILWIFTLQLATLVTHYFFRAHIFWQKCWNRTFSYWHFICLMTSKNNIGITTHANHFTTSNAMFTKSYKCNLNVYIFYLRFALGIIHGDRCYRKTPRKNIFCQVNPIFGVFEISNTDTLWKTARFDVILTSVTIINIK